MIKWLSIQCRLQLLQFTICLVRTFEKLTKQRADLLAPKINTSRRPTNIKIEELKKCILKHGKIPASAKELGCGISTVWRMLEKNNLKLVYNMPLIRGRNNHKIIGFEDLN